MLNFLIHVFIIFLSHYSSLLNQLPKSNEMYLYYMYIICKMYNYSWHLMSIAFLFCNNNILALQIHQKHNFVGLNLNLFLKILLFTHKQVCVKLYNFLCHRLQLSSATPIFSGDCLKKLLMSSFFCHYRYFFANTNIL